ncbi:MAG: dephospho-CoA kinase [Bacteroidia bacterium]|nr:dephospho-CoA kinase [Bacteroidia bacterium]MDW8235134.1 dephospho-CoA kinase [Bacteroidia bacterium]
MKVIGITGGIGVGKTFILEKIAQAGYPVYQADQRARQLMEEDSQLKRKIQELFGESAFQPDGKLNRAYIAERIFRETELRHRLNQLVHPRTIEDFLAWVAARQKEGYPAIWKEAALTLEAHAGEGLTHLVVVYAPLSVRLARLRQRGMSSEEALARMRTQWPEWRKIALADYCILNDGIHPLEPQLQQCMTTLSIPISVE